MTIDLTALEADAFADNPARVQEVLDAAAAFDDRVPVVLLPVRLETRFTVVEVPVPDPPTLDDVIAQLDATADALERIADADLSTIPVGTVRERRTFKREVEDPLYARVEADLKAAEVAFDALDALLRHRFDADEDGVRKAEAAVARVRKAFPAAEASLGRLRSEFHRKRLLAELAALELRAEPMLSAVDALLPGVRLRDALAAARPRDALARGGRRTPVVRGTPAEVAALAPGTVASIPSARLDAGATTYDALLERVRRLADPAGVAALAEEAGRIPLLPGAWKRELAAAVAATSARLPAAGLARLQAAVARIRSDDPALDLDVPRPDLTVALPAGTLRVDHMLVRIYPDDIAVDTHEEALTAEEHDAGIAFWRETSTAGADEALQRAAWRALCAGRGSRRAAWVAARTGQLAPGPTPGALAGAAILEAVTPLERRVEEVSRAGTGARLAALVRALDVVVAALQGAPPLPAPIVGQVRARATTVRARCERLDALAGRLPLADRDTATRERVRSRLGQLQTLVEGLDVEPPAAVGERDPGRLKEGAWTRAARSGVLPDRFVIVCVAGESVSHVVAGTPVPPDLKLSIDPAPEDEAAEAFALDADGDLIVGTSIRWMVDFEEALRKGMALRFPITVTEAAEGFDFVYAIGLCGGEEAAAGAARLEALLDIHHYGPTGLALLPVGTPTNNTEDAAAGYRSDDDADAAFPIERGAPLFDADDAAAAGADAADGLRLAQALGVDPDRLAHIGGADGRDGTDALSVGAAFHPATLGAALEELAGELISLDTRDRVAAFALAHVCARGLVPPFRVGPQPYGVLPAIAHSIYRHEVEETLAAGAPRAERERQDRFDGLLTTVLRELATDWARIRAERVPYAGAPDPEDAQAHFMALLGLEATSTVSSYRFAVNVANRHAPTRSPGAAGFGLDGDADAAFAPFALLERFEPILRDAFAVPAGPLLEDGLVSEAMAPVYERIQRSRAYELRLLETAYELRGSAAGTDPAADLTALLTTPPATLAADGRAGSEHNRSLAFLLARQALLLALRDAALRILAADGMVTEQARIDAGASAHYIVASLTTPLSITRWSYLFEPLEQVDGLLDMDFPRGAGTLFGHLDGGAASMDDYLEGRGTGRRFTSFPGNTRHTGFVQTLQDHAAAVERVAAIPAPRLDLLVREHLDLVSHRLDAWVTGLAQRRLAAMREARPRGAHVGAYGWVEALRPDAGHPLAGEVPAALATDPSTPIHSDPESQGFIHAPSVNQAVTAGILRGGYISQQGEDDVENRMAVNLSSRRTRLALGLIEGLRAGNELGALLGYRLERFLHEAYATQGVTLDDLIGPLRAAFPSVAGVDGSVGEEVAARQVCDGLAIAETVQAWIAANAAARAPGATVYEILADGGRYTGYPWGLTSAGRPAIPGTGERDRLDGVVRAIDHVADALDAVGDLVVAESVHQIAAGNHPRAAAALSALGEGKAPPRPEVADTPRTGLPVTHRLILQLRAAVAGTPPGWTGAAMTARGRAGPVANHWIAGLLGPAGSIRLRVVRADDGAEVGSVTMADLGLQPIDLAAIVAPGFETGLGELGARALDALRPADLDDAVPPPALQVDLGRSAGWPAAARTLVDVAPLLEAIAAVLGRGRPTDAHDYLLGEQAPEGDDSGVNLVELDARVQAARAELVDAGVALARLLAGDATLDETVMAGDPQVFLDAHAEAPAWEAREVWRGALLTAAGLGIAAALPPTRYKQRVEVLVQLQEHAASAWVELVVRLARADAALAGEATDTALLTAGRAVLGEAFPLLPRCTPRNRDELATALAAALATPAELDAWLLGAAAVRTGAAALAHLLVLADAHDAATPAGAVAQLPHVSGEAWAGGRLGPNAPSDGRLSLVVLGAEALAGAGDSGVGVLVDEWTEITPVATETTGVAIHYDQPDATPPQCVLVAVPPQRTGSWRLGDLVQTLHDTFELAKSRAVELEHLQDELYGQFLPAISGELVPEAIGTAEEPPGRRVILDFEANN